MLEILSGAAVIVAGLVTGWAVCWFVARIPEEGSDALGVYIRRQFRVTWRMIPKLVFLVVLVWPAKILLVRWLWSDLEVPHFWLGSIFLAPIIEEIVFRGLIFQALRERYCFLVGLVLSAALFAAGHGVPTIPQLSSFFLSGIGYALVYAWTGSLVPAILMHAAWNVFGLAPIW